MKSITKASVNADFGRRERYGYVAEVTGSTWLRSSEAVTIDAQARLSAQIEADGLQPTGGVELGPLRGLIDTPWGERWIEEPFDLARARLVRAPFRQPAVVPLRLTVEPATWSAE